MAYILLTGSSRGIGAAAAEALEARGVTVIGHQSAPGDETRVRGRGCVEADGLGRIADEQGDSGKGAVHPHRPAAGTADEE